MNRPGTMILALVILMAVADRSLAAPNSCSEVKNMVLDSLSATVTSDETALHGVIRQQLPGRGNRVWVPPTNWIVSQIPDAECPIPLPGPVTLPPNCYSLFSGGVMCCGIVPDYVSICCTSSGFCARSYF